ncbi:uncharacterized protein BDR25DRAFT_79683 [Lindgomyces ingoldianus]|uniref:Uncharacterized protein n=1 Tax=Lindgomyces ingoldianus TaxID=673940 RepID=A0ACB6QJ32_9PLEO|nr:uncharacterized protein BDR25DRAFT_79683 [Lindgomyces ingoldianus]KAF2466132.1 hypothetical protein BDR25DRAFT_79683 [Lindgomyces ingoldianus]
MSLPSLALPGQLLGPATKYAPGPGTHIHNSQIYASIAGPVVSNSRYRTPSNATTPTKPLPLVSISRPSSSTTVNENTLGILGTNSGGGSNILPEVESVVLAKVTRLGQRFATVEILVVADTVCREGFQGLIRREDVRATEKDRVRIEEVFRVGDLVRGQVVSLGDQSNYYLSTASDEFGVVMATSEAGNQMYPISWKEFQDPKTGLKESRKAAKPL